VEQELSSQLRELRSSANRSVLMVHVLGDDASLRLLHALQDERITVVITVSANAEVQFVRVRVVAPRHTEKELEESVHRETYVTPKIGSGGPISTPDHC
jgi:hypothetical protein